MFYPGETDIQQFTIPFPASDVGSVLISYKQRGRVLLEKTVTETEAVDDFACKVTLALTQAETLAFANYEDITIQLNVKSTGGERISSTPIVMRCGEQYHRSVI